MNKQINTIILLVFVLILINCEKEYDYPLIITGEVTDIDSTGAVFHGKITSIGSSEFAEYGFVWGSEKRPDMDSSNVTIGITTENGIITSRITNDLIQDEIYYVRAFAKNENYATYGYPVMFKSMGSLLPTISGFSPQKGTNGTKVSIIGDNFSSSIKNNIVSFGHTTALVDSASKNKLVVIIPHDNVISGFVNIRIEVAGQKVFSEEYFKLDGVTINNFYPKELYASDTLYLEGEGFSPILVNNIVKLGNNKATVTNISDNILTALVNYNQTSGLNDISITVNGKTCYTNDSLKILDTWGSIVSNETFDRWETVGFSINSKGYVGTGLNIDLDILYNDLWEYTLETNIWRKCASVPASKRSSDIGFSIGGKGYIGLGHNNTGFNPINFNDIYKYDPETDTWTRKNDFPGNGNGYTFCLVIGEKAYLGFEYKKDFWEYDPVSDNWTRLSDFPSVFDDMIQGFQIGNKGYFASKKHPFATELWEYNPENDKWTYLSDFPGVDRNHATCFSLNGFGYIGMGGGKVDFWRYNVKKNDWTRIADIHYSSRTGAVSFTIDNRAYITSGTDKIFFNPQQNESLIIFNPNW